MAELRNAWRHLGRLPEVARATLVFRRPWSITRQYLRLEPPDMARGIALRDGGAIDIQSYEDLVTAWIIFCRREYRVPAFARAMVDVGANIGCFTVFAMRERPQGRVVAFEPMPPTFARLEQTLRWNGIEKSATAIPAGVAAATGRRAIPAASAPSQSLGMVGAHDDAGAGATPIDVLSFDELVRRSLTILGAERIDFMKMDVEGAEHEAIAAASDDTLRLVTALAMEYHPNGSKPVLFERLSASGLKLVHDRRIGPAAGVAHFSR